MNGALSFSESFTSAAMTQLWQVTVVILIAILLTRIFAKRPHLTFTIWMIVVLKCITPPIISSPTGLFCWQSEAPHEVAMMEIGAANGVETENDKGTINGQIEIETPRALAEYARERGIAADSFSKPELQTMPIADSISGRVASAPDLEGDFTMSNESNVDSSNADNLLGSPVGVGTGPTSENNPLTVHDRHANDIPRWSLLLSVVWILGIAFYCVFSIVRFQLCMHRIRKTSSPVKGKLKTQFDALVQRIGMRRPVEYWITTSRIGPAVVGLFRPKVVIPQIVIDKVSVKEIEAILAHELVHIKRGDLFFSAIQLIAQAAWWFHPLVWLANRLANLNAERCCDQQVIAELECNPADYARSLVSVLETKQRLESVVGFPGVRPIEITEQRLKRIMNIKPNQTRRAWLTWSLLLLLSVIVLPGASVGNWQEKAKQKSNQRIKKNQLAGSANSQNKKEQSYAGFQRELANIRNAKLKLERMKAKLDAISKESDSPDAIEKVRSEIAIASEKLAEMQRQIKGFQLETADLDEDGLVDLYASQPSKVDRTSIIEQRSNWGLVITFKIQSTIDSLVKRHRVDKKIAIMEIAKWLKAMSTNPKNPSLPKFAYNLDTKSQSLTIMGSRKDADAVKDRLSQLENYGLDTIHVSQMVATVDDDTRIKILGRYGKDLLIRARKETRNAVVNKITSQLADAGVSSINVGIVDGDYSSHLSATYSQTGLTSAVDQMKANVKSNLKLDEFVAFTWQTPVIKDTIQRPFVVGHSPQPEIKIVEEGISTVLSFTENGEADITFRASKITDVEEQQKEDKAWTKTQKPILNQLSVKARVEISDLSQTFVMSPLENLDPEKSDEFLVFFVTVRRLPFKGIALPTTSNGLSGQTLPLLSDARSSTRTQEKQRSPKRNLKATRDVQLDDKTALNPIVVFAPSIAQTDKVHVKNGDQVKKGDRLFSFKNESLVDDIAIQEIELMAAEHRLATAQINLKHAEQGLEKGRVSRPERDAARNNADSLKIELRLSHKKLEILKKRQTALRINAPISGRISRIQVPSEPNAPIQSGQALLLITPDAPKSIRSKESKSSKPTDISNPLHEDDSLTRDYQFPPNPQHLDLRSLQESPLLPIQRIDRR